MDTKKTSTHYQIEYKDSPNLDSYIDYLAYKVLELDMSEEVLCSEQQ